MEFVTALLQFAGEHWGWFLGGVVTILGVIFQAFVAECAKDIYRSARSLPARFQDWVDGEKSSGRRLHTLPLPPLGRHFTGRTALLRDLRRVLRRRPGGGSAPRAAVRADGGIGKTTLAIEVAHQLFAARKFDFVLFLNATTPDTLDLDLSRLCDADRLDLPAREQTQLAPRVAAAIAWLRDSAHARRTLLLLDNADAPEAQARVRELHRTLPDCALLITTRARIDRDIREHSLGLFTTEESRAFLRPRISGRPSTADLDALATAVDHLPLALEIVVSYLGATHQTPAEWLREWQSAPARTLAHHNPAETPYRDSLDRVWRQPVARLSPDARALLHALALFAPRPADLPLNGLKQSSNWIATRDLLVELHRAALITWPDGRDAVSLHRVLQLVTLAQITPDEAAAARTLAIKILAESTPATEWNAAGWALWARLSPHFVALLAALSDTVEESGAAELLNEFGVWLFRRAQHSDAEFLFRRALTLREKSLGPDHPEVATSLNNLAGLLQATNRLADAEPIFLRALAIRESLGPDHPKVATSLNNLAFLLKATNRLSDAEPLYRRALAIREKSLGPDHPEVATSLNNLATLLQNTNRLSDAEPLFRRALAIDENCFGPEHPEVATSLNNLATLLQDTNRISDAEPLFRRAIAINEQSLGPEHPEVATSLNNLALLLHATNRLPEAVLLFRRALEVLALFAKRTGYEHPHFRDAESNYASVLADLGWRPEAIRAHLAELTSA